MTVARIAPSKKASDPAILTLVRALARLAARQDHEATLVAERKVVDHEVIEAVSIPARRIEGAE